MAVYCSTLCVTYLASLLLFQIILRLFAVMNKTVVNIIYFYMHSYPKIL